MDKNNTKDVIQSEESFLKQRLASIRRAWEDYKNAVLHLAANGVSIPKTYYSDGTQFNTLKRNMVKEVTGITLRLNELNPEWEGKTNEPH